MPEKKRVAVYDIARKKTKTVGIIVNKLDSHFITCALKGIETVTTARGYDIIITHSQESMEKEAKNVQLLFDRKVDGVIASLSVETCNLSHFSAFTDKGIPVVYFDRAQIAGNGGMVGIDNSKCGFLATEHLTKQACRRIAIITSSLTTNIYAERYKGFREALNKYNIPFDDELLILVDIEKDGGADAAEKIIRMDPMPDGLFITNDLAAAMCMQALKDAGIRVPEDIAIVGFNNDPVGRLIKPTLTTIDYPGHEIGKVAASSLLDQLSGKRSPGQTRALRAIVPSALIVRASSIKAINLSKE
ncbi:LacI family DNA-binding transcriptional regulator [Flavitalea flava]